MPQTDPSISGHALAPLLSLGSTEYKYSPLNEENHEIRLLTILPGDFSSDIRVCLHTVSFTESSDVRFEALSYAWGSLENPVGIFVGKSGQQTVRVTQNLGEALPYLRYNDKPRIIWIDAICVNQQDLRERSSQVKRMADIYSSASQVLVWLGPASENIALAKACCEEVSANIAVDWDQLTMAQTPLSQETHWVDLDIVLPWSPAQGHAVCDLLSRRWFSRLWIWQEVALARSVLVICGSYCLTWESIRDTVFASYFKTRTFLIINRLNKHHDLLVSLCQSQKPLQIDTLLDYTRNTICSDPRDRLFALFSMLLPEEKKIAIEVDYTKTTMQVYFEFARTYITNKNSLSILKCVEMDEDVPKGLSWVPNWSLKNRSLPLQRIIASGFSKKVVTFGFGGIMQIAGCKVDTIDWAECFRPLLSQAGDSYYYEIASELRRVIGILNTQSPLGKGSQNLRSLCSVICGGQIVKDWSPSVGTNIPTPKEAEECISAILMHDPEVIQLSEHTKHIIHQFHRYTKGRNLFKCQDGMLGLAPAAARPGDIVAVWLALDNPMILRPTCNGRHLLVGEAYCDGFMCGEALLGPLPENVDFDTKFDTEYGGNFAGFIDRKSGKFHSEDPRLSGVQLPAGWSKKKHPKEELCTIFVSDETGEETACDPRMSADELRSRGVELQVFEVE